MSFYDLSSEVTLCHFCRNLLVKTVTSPNQILGEGTETPSLLWNGKVRLQKSM